ncbi:MAG TPA: hypothetical protein VFF06_18090 [Polyangia bacterium]|nr:hypothetical protein [Polyangia bacterium]
MVRLRALLVGSLIALTLGSCVVEEPGYRNSPCAGGIWIRGHRGPRGRWWPGHWRCPGVREVIEIE